MFLRLIEPKERQKKEFNGVSNNGEVVIPVKEYTTKFRVITHGNVNDIPLGGQAEPVDLSNHTALLQTVRNGVPLWGGMSDELADNIMKSVIKTLRLEITKDYEIYVHISIPELPEGFGILNDFSIIFGDVGTGPDYREFGYNDFGTCIIERGNYKLSVRTNFSEIEKRKQYYENVAEFTFTLGICYAYKTPGTAWATPLGEYSGYLYDLRTATPQVSRHIKDYTGDIFEYWDGLM